MARTLQFDHTTAIEEATRLFWQGGYANTSLRDLLKGMGIGESSFYNTLKSKKHAYLAALKHYNATVGARRAQAFLSAPTASEGVRALFGTMLDCLDDPATPSQICLMAGTVTPEVLEDPDLRAYVEEQIATLVRAMTERLTVDQQTGRLPDGLDPCIVASVILTYMQGLWRMALLSYDRPKFERQIDVFLRGMGL